MNGVDLKLFQFDYDQTWCVFFLNADGTIYGRYGTRAGNGNRSMTHISVASLRKSMERALELHAAYPANKAQLTGKLGRDPEYRTAQRIPGLTEKPARATPEQHNSCIHCHHVQAYVGRSKWQQGRLTYDDVWVWTLPENIGLKMDVDDGLLVRSVSPHSPAAEAGIRPHDELLTLNGQRLISQADIQWVLHNAPVETELDVTWRRSGQTLAKAVRLSGHWKESDLAWRGSSLVFGLRNGLMTVRLTGEQKRARGIAPDGLALRVRRLLGDAGRLGELGLRVDDVIVALDGEPDISESQFLARLRLDHPPGDQIKLTVLRGHEQHELELPIW